MSGAGKVLVLGSDTRAFLAVVRSLGRRGAEVHVGWCPATSAARRSRYIAHAHDIPPIQDGAWKDTLVRLIEQERYDLVIPCDDPTSIPLHTHRAAFEPLDCVYLLSPGAFDVTTDKIRSYRLAASLGVAVPRSVVASSDTDPGTITSTLGLPVVVKPRRTFSANDVVNRHSVRVARTAEDLAAALRVAADGDEALVQEHIAGVGTGVEVLAHQGNIMAAFQHVRVHEPPHGGGSSYRKSVPLHPALREATAALLAALEYTGVAMVEFKIDPASGRGAFMEINGRFWGSLPLALAAGADFPYYLFELLVRGRRDFPQRYATGLYSRNLWLDGVWMLQNTRVDRRDRTLITVPWPRIAGELVHLITLRERIDTLVADDPMPGVVEFAQLSGALATKASAKTSMALLRLPPVRRRQRARAHRALSTAQGMLFVCKGNICRSPFAAAYARRLLPGAATVTSAGYYPKTGRRPPEAALAAASAMGVHLGDHRSRIISEEAVKEADVIFVFDANDLAMVRRRFPAARSKTFLLGLLSPQGATVITDPYGKSGAEFDHTYRTIASSLDSVLSSERIGHVGIRPGLERSTAAQGPVRSRALCSVVIHSFNRRPFLDRALSALSERALPRDLEVIVSDSGSTDGSRELVIQKYPWVRLLELPEDRGLAAGRNAGIRVARGAYVVVMDEDVVVTPNLIDELIQVMEARPDAGVVTCCKVDERGGALYRHHVPAPSSLRLPFFIVMEWSIQETLRAVKAFLHVGAERPHETAQMVEIPFVGGAFALVRSDAIAQVGLLDESIFFYGEDFDWWYRFRRRGWKILYLPQVTVQAFRGMNTHRSRRASLIALQSRRYLFAKYVGRWNLPVYAVIALIGLIPRTVYYLLQTVRGQSVAEDIPVGRWLWSAVRVIAGRPADLSLQKEPPADAGH